MSDTAKRLTVSLTANGRTGAVLRHRLSTIGFA